MRKRQTGGNRVLDGLRGDQPIELVEGPGYRVWAIRGQSTKYMPEYHFSTPDTVWDHGLTPGSGKGGMNSQMFNNLDGTKSALEMAAIPTAH